MSDFRPRIERLARFAHDAFLAVLHLPWTAASLFFELTHALLVGGVAGLITGAAVAAATGWPFTAVLVGGLWAAATAAHTLFTRAAGGRGGEED